jgi:hypothetical protein
LGVELSVRIAEGFGWSDERTLGTEAAAVFHYAMRAEKARWQRFDDIRVATSFIQLAEQNDRRAILQTVNEKLAGPGVPISVESTLAPEVRERLDECNRERDAAYDKLREAGLL